MINHIMIGLKWKIPLCCIFFFIKKTWTTKYIAYEVDKGRGGGDDPDNYTPINPKLQHVQCDKCYEKYG
jgi:hypothetical protein